MALIASLYILGLAKNVHCLRNRKMCHVPCFYQVIETSGSYGEQEICGNTSRRRMFPQLFRLLPYFHECFYNSIETRRTCSPFLLANTVTKKGKQLVNFDYQIVNYLCSHNHYVTSCASSVSLSSYRNTIFNQSARVFS